MDGAILGLLSVCFTFLFFVFQRVESKKRRIVFLLYLVLGELIRRYVVYRGIESEATAAFILAIVLNFLFWALIGRYNPVGSSDNIKVYGLDD